MQTSLPTPQEGKQVEMGGAVGTAVQPGQEDDVLQDDVSCLRPGQASQGGDGCLRRRYRVHPPAEARRRGVHLQEEGLHLQVEDSLG